MKISFGRSTLKIIAIIAMTIDHIGELFFKDAGYLYFLMRSIGAITFPIMAYMVGEGYRYTKNLKKYKIKLLLFSLISVLPFALAFGRDTYGLNVGFTLLFGLYAIEIYDKFKNNTLKWILIALILISSFWFDWGFFGCGLILLFYISKGRKKHIIFALIATVILFVIRNQVYYLAEYGRLIPFKVFVTANAFLRLIGFIPAGLIILSYNGVQKKRMKYLYYIYYPLHLAILGIIIRLVK